MSLLAQLDQKIAANGGLIVSCQPVPDSPLDKPGNRRCHGISGRAGGRGRHSY